MQQMQAAMLRQQQQPQQQQQQQAGLVGRPRSVSASGQHHPGAGGAVNGVAPAAAPPTPQPLSEAEKLQRDLKRMEMQIALIKVC
jgi:hypothetical protein